MPAGALVWLGNALSFALLYWLDRQRRVPSPARETEPVDFAFTQHMSPELARPAAAGLPRLPPPRLHERDAFSPTDVMPLAHRAKFTMVVQASVALALFGLIVARSVNAFA